MKKNDYILKRKIPLFFTLFLLLNTKTLFAGDLQSELNLLQSEIDYLQRLPEGSFGPPDKIEIISELAESNFDLKACLDLINVSLSKIPVACNYPLKRIERNLTTLKEKINRELSDSNIDLKTGLDSINERLNKIPLECNYDLRRVEEDLTRLGKAMEDERRTNNILFSTTLKVQSIVAHLPTEDREAKKMVKINKGDFYCIAQDARGGEFFRVGETCYKDAKGDCELRGFGHCGVIIAEYARETKSRYTD